MPRLESDLRSNRYAVLSLDETKPEDLVTSDDALEPDIGAEAVFQVESNLFAFSPDQSSNMLGSLTLHDIYMMDEIGHESFATFIKTLDPESGTKTKFKAEESPFAFTPSQLGKMFNPKSLGAFYALGGLRGLEKGLRSDRHAGLNLNEAELDGSVTFEDTVNFEDAVASHPPKKHYKPEEALRKIPGARYQSSSLYQDRKRIYGDNRLCWPAPRNFFQLLWGAYQDKVLLLLTIASAISLALELYQMYSTETSEEKECEGLVPACTTMAIVVCMAFASSLKEHREWRRAPSNGPPHKEDWPCTVMRSGTFKLVPARDILVGDILFIKAGDIVPADGVLVEGCNVGCDESSITGEFHIIRKCHSDQVYMDMINDRPLRWADPFLISGSHIVEGVGTMMCTATGAHSSYSKVVALLDKPPACLDPVTSTELSITAGTKADAVHAALFLITILVSLILQLTHYAPLDWPALQEIISNTLLIKFYLTNFATSVATLPWAMFSRAVLSRRLNIWEAWAALRANIDVKEMPASAKQPVMRQIDLGTRSTARKQRSPLNGMQSNRNSRTSFLAEEDEFDSFPPMADLRHRWADFRRNPGGIGFGRPWPEPSTALRSCKASESLPKSLMWIKGRPGVGKSTLMRTTRTSESFIEGLANGNHIQAFPDNGADRCSISPQLAAKLGLQMTPGTERTLRLPNGSYIQSPGMVELSWKFEEEPEERKLQCWVVPGCVHDLILGSPFLRATQTLTKFAHRIKSKLVNPYGRLHVRLLGDTQQRLRGSLDGHETLAMADSGSDVMLISQSYAQKCGLHVDRDPTNSINLEFVDGSTEWTNGIVRNVPWSVEGTIQYCDFYVLDSLCEDLILSNTCLTEMNSFVNHADSFFDLSQPREVSQLCLIRLIGRFSSILNLLELDYLKDLTSPDAFNDEKVRRELARRDQIRDEILALPLSEQEAATRAETERQLAWENHREAHRQGWRAQLAGPLLYSTSSESGGSSGVPLAGQGFAAANQLETGRQTSPRDGKHGKSRIGKMAIFRKLVRAKP